MRHLKKSIRYRFRWLLKGMNPFQVERSVKGCSLHSPDGINIIVWHFLWFLVTFANQQDDSKRTWKKHDMPNFAVWCPTTVNFFCSLTNRLSATSGGPKFGNL